MQVQNGGRQPSRVGSVLKADLEAFFGESSALEELKPAWIENPEQGSPTLKDSASTGSAIAMASQCPGELECNVRSAGCERPP